MGETQSEDFRAGSRTQLEWGFGGRRRWRDGALLMALFFGGIGGGQFVVSTWLVDYTTSALVGLLLVAIGKTLAHVIYLGRPWRFYRMFLRPKTSWISRGLIFMIGFVIFGAMYLAPEMGFEWVPWEQDTGTGQAMLFLAIVFAFLLMVYDGFALASCKSITSWHTALLPIMFFTYALAGGVAMTYLTTIAVEGSGVAEADLVTIDAVLLSTMAALVLLYVMNLAGSDTTGRESLQRLIRTRVAIFFVGVAILAGLTVPLALALFESSTGQTVASGMLALSALLELAGDLSVRHSILRAGLHSSLLPRPGTGA